MSQGEIMYIKRIFPNANFGRALTSAEKEQYKKIVRSAKKELNIQDTTAIIFDFNVPSEKGYNTGIGTTFSESANKFGDFLKSMADINSIQMQPQGKISITNTSPYSGTNYAFGEHIIDLKKLTTPQYASLLSINDIQEIDDNYPSDKEQREYRTDYEYVIVKGIQNKFLNKAFSVFMVNAASKEPAAVKLNKEFTEFKANNADWLEKNALYEVLSSKYGTSDFRKWEEIDRYLYSDRTSADERKNRINQLLAENKNQTEFENFKQFIADKQQKDSKKSFNSKDIKIYGDCLIGFSQSEMWGDIDCFRDNLYYGGPDPNCPETNNIQTWGLPALDYTTLGECEENGDISKLGKTGKLLYNKYSKFFERYDGIRVDAAWQFATPFIYQAINGSYEEVKQPEINYTIFNIMKAAAKKVSSKARPIDNNAIMLELVGLSAGRSREMTLNKFPHLYTTAYAEYDECPAKFIEKGYKQGNFYVGAGCHDNDSLINMAKDTAKREMHTNGIMRDYNFDLNNLAYKTREYTLQSQDEKTLENYRNAKLAEIFTSYKQFFTLPDMFGMEQRINISGKSDKNNWTIRIPSNYEEFYYKNLAKGYGLNLPKVLAAAMQMRKIDNPDLIKKCNEAAEILRSDGPMTEKEADLSKKKGLLKNTFA